MHKDDPRTPEEDTATMATTTTTTTRGAATQRNPSPRKSVNRVLPTPTSLSPTKQRSPPEPRLPPSFESNSHIPPVIASRYTPGVFTPHSPYRPGEYQRSECAPSERTRIERKLFNDDDDGMPTRNGNSSSPLQPPFESKGNGEVKMVLRNGAPVDLISWLRTNFHHQPPPHTPVTSFMSLAHVQRLLQERFPRVPVMSELHRAVLAAFPHSEWEESPDGKEPPIMRGLTWHGRDVAEEDDPITPGRPSRANGVGRRREANGVNGSRSPTNSPLMSPVSTHRQVPDTPARSVLDEFAELATRTPVVKERSLDTERGRAAAYALSMACSSVDRSWDRSKKRRASGSPDRARRRASTPDALQELLDAAEAVEGSPLNSVLLKSERGHKRRRTIGSSSRDGNGMSIDRRRATARGTASPKISGLALIAGRDDPMDRDEDEPVSPLASEESGVSQLVAMGQPQWRRGHASSTTSQLSAISETVGLAGPPSAGPSKGAGRKVNELPTSSQGQFPGVDCKPPYPYHEMIRFAIEHAPDRKLQLAQIYSSIADRFPFFKTLDEKKTAGWQNSIRHNLSLKKMFVRVNKGDGTPDDTGGKGGWWTVQPGVPDEGRPGRKAKAKRAKDGMIDTASVATSVTGTPTPTIAPSLPSASQVSESDMVFESGSPPVKHEVSDLRMEPPPPMHFAEPLKPATVESRPPAPAPAATSAPASAPALQKPRPLVELAPKPQLPPPQKPRSKPPPLAPAPPAQAPSQPQPQPPTEQQQPQSLKSEPAAPAPAPQAQTA